MPVAIASMVLAGAPSAAAALTRQLRAEDGRAIERQTQNRSAVDAETSDCCADATGKAETDIDGLAMDPRGATYSLNRNIQGIR
jgi:hypothetical protein